MLVCRISQHIELLLRKDFCILAPTHYDSELNKWSGSNIKP